MTNMTKPAIKPKRKPATQAIPRLNRNALIFLGLWIFVAIISNSGVSLLGEETWKQWVAHILLGIAQVLTQFLTGGSAGSIGTTGTSGISRPADLLTGPLVAPPGLIDEGILEAEAVDAAEPESE
jgi:hypothetical protein